MALKLGDVRPLRRYRIRAWRQPVLVIALLLLIVASLAGGYLFRKPLRDGAYDVLEAVLVYKNRGTMERSFVLPDSWFNTQGAPLNGVLRVSSENPRYFADGNGNEVYLTGSHTWSNLQDTGAPPVSFSYPDYLDFLASQGHNFFRLWAWEQAKWGSWTNSGIEFSPPFYPRTGPGTALDGKPKFDLTQFNAEYFTRLRERVQAAQDRGIYVSVMLFDGWSIELKDGNYPNPWPGHPYNRANNINSINGDVNGDEQGSEIHTLSPDVSAVTELQKAYIRKVVDAVNDLDNVLYEISNESGTSSTAWQYAMIDYVKEYESTKPKQHPVGMTAQYPGGNNDVLFASPADWIAPNGGGGYMDNPPANNGQKVIVADTDHLWGIGGNVPWLWKSVTRGLNTLFMDPYDCSPFWPPAGCDTATWEGLRRNMGYARAYMQKMNLGQAVPRSELCSTGYCLANTSAGSAEYLVYQPNGGAAFTVDLTDISGSLDVEWLNPGSGAQSSGGSVSSGGMVNFTPPFNSSDGAVLLLQQRAAVPPTPTLTTTPSSVTSTATPATTPAATITLGATPSVEPPPSTATPSRGTPTPDGASPTFTPTPTGTRRPVATTQAVTPTAYIFLPAVEGQKAKVTVPPDNEGK